MLHWNVPEEGLLRPGVGSADRGAWHLHDPHLIPPRPCTDVHACACAHTHTRFSKVIFAIFASVLLVISLLIYMNTRCNHFTCVGPTVSTSLSRRRKIGPGDFPVQRYSCYASCYRTEVSKMPKQNSKIKHQLNISIC